MKTPLTPAQLARRLRLLANDMHDVAILLELDETNALPGNNQALIQAARLQNASIIVREWANLYEKPPKA